MLLLKLQKPPSVPRSAAPGLDQLAVAAAAAKSGGEAREAALRDGVAAALKRMRAYARDMEEALDRERLGLEGMVVKEIKVRQGACFGGAWVVLMGDAGSRSVWRACCCGIKLWGKVRGWVLSVGGLRGG